MNLRPHFVRTINHARHHARQWSALALGVVVLLFIQLLLVPIADAAILIPKNLSAQDRLTALRILGMGTSSKILSNPYPLGGYEGFEAGFSLESISTDDLGRLGATLPSPQRDVAYPKLTLGKGVYNNLDVFIQFTPYNRTDEISQFGGIVRWGFYQAEFMPLSASVLFHMNNGNVSNLITTHSYGCDFIGGMNVGDVSLFAGLGYLEATGTFAGGGNAITASGQLENEVVVGTHTVVGANVRMLKNAFIALQIDRYTAPVFSGKLGARF